MELYCDLNPKEYLLSSPLAISLKLHSTVLVSPQGFCSITLLHDCPLSLTFARWQMAPCVFMTLIAYPCTQPIPCVAEGQRLTVSKLPRTWALFLLTFLATSEPAIVRLSTAVSERTMAGSSGGGKYCSTRKHLTCETSHAKRSACLQKTKGSRRSCR